MSKRLGARVLSILVDYPPTRVELAEDLSAVRGGRVLLIEDDVVGAGARSHQPGEIAMNSVWSLLAKFANALART